MLANPAQHRHIDASDTVGSAVTSSPLTAAGQIFTMEMTYDYDNKTEHYRTENHVTRFEPPRVMEWAVAPAGDEVLGWRWRYEVTPEGENRSTVTRVYDWTGTPEANMSRYGVPAFNECDLASSLDGLAGIFEP